MVNILIVEDDLETLSSMEQYLEREGYTILKTLSAREALHVAEESVPDLFVINTFLPSGMDGLMLCRKLRANPHTANTPIIFLTNQGTRHAVTDALDAGGDDYIRKPFALRELSARVRAHLRRVAGGLNDGSPVLRIIPDNLTVFVNERKVVLTQVEFDLLKFLCRTPHQLHSTEDLLMDVWQYPRGSGDAALVRNHIRNLRRKLEDDPERPAIIQSRHGRGYGVKARIHFETPAMTLRTR